MKKTITHEKTTSVFHLVRDYRHVGGLFLHNMIAGSLTVKNIPYSEFVKAVKEGRVSEIAISENEIQGRMIGSEDGRSVKHAFPDHPGGS
jgi:hypothetical protein